MPRSIPLKPVSNAALVRATGKTFSSNYPKKSVTQQELRAAMKSWQMRQPPPGALPVKETKVNAVRLGVSDITKLRRISESPTPTAEAIVGQKMGPDQILGTLYSSLAALEFTKMESEFKSRMADATDPNARTKVQSQWNQVVKAAQQAFAAGGLKGLTETDLRGFSQELRKNKANFNSIVNIANSGVAVGAPSEEPQTAPMTVTGGWVPQTGVYIDPKVVGTFIIDLCDKPFAEGVFTQHFSNSFNLTVRLYVPCPKWTNPFRWCWKNFTLAGVSFSLDLQVGYRVTCCGATAWGEASAQACGTIIGIKLCAGCTAKITGVAGVGRSGSGDNCTYGLGLNALLECTYAGLTVFQLQVPFGYTVNAPCPPFGLCK